MSNIYARITPLKSSSGGAAGRVEYISDPERQENIIGFYSTMDKEMWKQLADERRADNKSSGQYDTCIEAKEITLAIPHRIQTEGLAEKLAVDFRQTYGVPAAVAIHSKGEGKNVHAHIVFSESKLLDEPAVKIASRNMFYDENGKHCRTKKEILNEKGEVREGCSIIRKGEIYKTKYFGGKLEQLKSNNNAYVFKQHYAEMLNLEIYNAQQPRIKQIKYGKGNSREADIKAYNNAAQKWNSAAAQQFVLTPAVTRNITKFLKEKIKGLDLKRAKSTLNGFLNDFLSSYGGLARINDKNAYTFDFMAYNEKDKDIYGLEIGAKEKQLIQSMLEAETGDVSTTAWRDFLSPEEESYLDEIEREYDFDF